MRKELPKYTIITKLRVHDETRDSDDEVYREMLHKEQTEKEIILGLNKSVLCHYFDSPYFNDNTFEMTSIDEAIQWLAIKDGVDLVQYSNGNYGYVAYYNGNENGFEVIG